MDVGISKSAGSGCDIDAGRTGISTHRKHLFAYPRLRLLQALSKLMVATGILLYITACARPPLIENAALNQERIYEVIERASAASRMQVIHPLSVKLISRTEIRKLLHEAETSEARSDTWAASAAGQTAMGLAPESNPVLDAHIALLSRAAEGFYVPESKTLFMVGERARSASGGIYLNSLGNLGREVTLAHEVIHALQHQHYPALFERDETQWAKQTDAALALQAAKEGDATLWAAQSAGLLGTAKDPEDVIEESRDAVGPLADTSALVRELLLFPYTYGYRFAHHEGAAGLQSPPASTEQIIHAESRRRDFQAIDVAAFTRSVETEGCRPLYQDTMGELTLSWWLRNLDSTVTQEVWDGWDGDRWMAMQCGTGREIAWLTSWDKEKDAVEFEQAISAMTGILQTRAHLQSLVVNRRGREVVLASGALGSKVEDLRRLASRARVTTRGELAAHFASRK